MMRKNKHSHTRMCSRCYFVKGGDRYCRSALPRQRTWMCISFFTFIPCILILSKFFLFTSWCTRELL